MITAFYKKNLKKISEGKKNDAAYNVKRKNSQSRCETGRIKLCGSITIDPKLMEAAGILEYEQVQIVDVENGNRFETYTIDGEPGSGMICLNGAAARQVQVGDHVIIMAYCQMDAKEAADHKPKVVFVDEENHISRVSNYEKHGQLS